MPAGMSITFIDRIAAVVHADRHPRYALAGQPTACWL